jgi:hypothetical protein
MDGGSRWLTELIEQRNLTPHGWILAVQTTKIGLKNLFNPIFYDQLGPKPPNISEFLPLFFPSSRFVAALLEWSRATRTWGMRYSLDRTSQPK